MKDILTDEEKAILMDALEAYIIYDLEDQDNPRDPADRSRVLGQIQSIQTKLGLGNLLT